MISESKAFDAVLNGRAVLFVGAGFSRDAKNFAGANIPTGYQFTAQLSEALGESLEDGDTLLSVTNYFVTHPKGGDARLAEILNQTFRIQSPAKWQTDVAQLPWKRIYTTNYDDLIERAREGQQRTCRAVTPVDSAENFARSTNICVHINGYVERMTAEQIHEQVRLGTLSYAIFDFHSSEWSRVLRHDCEAAEAVLFVGYGMSDLDLQRIFVADRLKAKTLFVVGSDVSERTRATLSNFGTVSNLSGASFAERIAAYANTVSAEDRKPLIPWTSFQLWDRDYKLATPNDTDRWRLFLSGKLNIDTLRSARANIGDVAFKYVVNRTINVRALEWLESGRDAILLGRVANGKTIALKSIAADALARGIRVIEFVRETEATPNEIDRILENEERTLILIDDCYSHMEAVARIASRRHANTVLLMTGKTQGFAYFRSALESALRSRFADLNQYRLDTLDPQEQNEFLDAFESLALLGTEYSGVSRERLNARVSGIFSSQLQTILIEIVKSEVVQSRIASALGLDGSSRERQKVLASALVLSLVASPTVLDVSEVSGVRAANSALADHGEHGLTEVLETRNGQLSVTSAVLARHILCRVIEPGIAFEALKAAQQYCYEMRARPGFERVWHELMRFAQVQHVLPETDRKRWLLAYYEWMKNEPFSKGNADFWLQYGVARLFSKDIEEAGRCLETAETIAKRQNNSAVLERIHNHYARFLIESVEDEVSADTAFTFFTDANRIVARQMSNDAHRHYPFRIAKNYVFFYDQFFARLEQNQKLLFLQACDRVFQRAVNASQDLQAERAVKECARDFARLLVANRALASEGGFSDSLVQADHLTRRK